MNKEDKEQKEYKVTLDISIMDTLYVEADSEEEAIEKAKKETNYVDGTKEVFEVQEL